MRLFPRWPVTEGPSDTRKWLALLASFGGAMVFTAGAAVLVWIIWKGGWSPETEAKRLDLLGWAMIMMLAGSISTNWAFGFVLNRRSLRISKDGIEASGGDEPAVPVKVTNAPDQPVPVDTQAPSGDPR